jgi:hypothetical protein
MWALSSFLSGRPRGELDLLRLAVVVPQVLVDELRAVVRVDAPRRKGNASRSSASARCTATWLFRRTAVVSTQVVWMSVRLSECPNSPSPRLPQWATRSISVKPRGGHRPAIRLEGDVVFETQGPGIARSLPDGPQGLDDGGAIGPGAALGRPRGAGRRPIEQPDGVFAVRARDLAELIQDAPLPRRAACRYR